MKCSRARDLFSVHAESTIDPELGMAFEEHLASCPACKAAYNKFNATVMMLEELPEVELPVGFHESIMSRIEQAGRATPAPVRWWNLDWGRVFTVRVPARAMALGFAILLLMGMAYHLTPLGTITAGFFVGSKPVDTQCSTNQDGTVRIIGPWGSTEPATAVYDMDEAGISVAVKTEGATRNASIYSLRLQTRNAEPVPCKVAFLPNEVSCGVEMTSDITTPSGYVSKNRDFVVKLSVAGAQSCKRARVARITWSYGACKFSQYVMLPAQFDPKSSSKALTILEKDTTVGKVLARISAEYGVVVLASGNLDRRVPNYMVHGGSPEEALFALVEECDMDWKPLAASVYKVGPSR